jgi:Protein of unknown function (DUF3616)
MSKSNRSRRANFWGWTLAAIAALSAYSWAEGAPQSPLEFRGMSDASAGVALGGGLFVAADDEQNILRVYERSRPGEPVAAFDLGPYLELETKSPEVDLEAAAPAGDRVYWISSHGTNKNGKVRANRRRFFATRFEVANGKVKMEMVGRPYKHLVEDLVADPQLKKYNIAAKAKLAPKTQGGLNIEGMTFAPGGELLLGLRSPLADRRAIVIPLLNPNEVLTGAPAKFGKPIELTLDGLGVRSLTYRPDRKDFAIIAGPQSSGTNYLYRWSGKLDDDPTRVPGLDFSNWNPEAGVIDPASAEKRLFILSDDGDKMNPQKRRFRAGWVAY